MNLKKHLEGVHNFQRDHKCKSCGKAFSHAVVLKKHINIVHNGITNVTPVEYHFPEQII